MPSHTRYISEYPLKPCVCPRALDVHPCPCPPDGVQTLATRADTLDTTSSTPLRGAASAPPPRRTGSRWAWACAATETLTPKSSGTAPTSRSRPVSKSNRSCIDPKKGVRACCIMQHYNRLELHASTSNNLQSHPTAGVAPFEPNFSDRSRSPGVELLFRMIVSRVAAGLGHRKGR